MDNVELVHDLLVRRIAEAAEKCGDLLLLDLVLKMLTAG